MINRTGMRCIERYIFWLSVIFIYLSIFVPSSVYVLAIIFLHLLFMLLVFVQMCSLILHYIRSICFMSSISTLYIYLFSQRRKGQVTQQDEDREKKYRNDKEVELIFVRSGNKLMYVSRMFLWPSEQLNIETLKCCC